MNKMRTDLELLKSFYLPEFQRLPSFANTLEKEISNESFWNNFNSILLSSKELNTDLADYFKKYSPDNFENLVDRVVKIKREYLSHLANDFCNDHTNPSIELLLQNQNQEFLEEISFEKDLIIAITHTERTRLKKKLSLTDEALEFEITDAEINSAFDTIERQDLKNKMKEWDKESDFKPIQEEVGQSLLRSAKESSSIIRSIIKHLAGACIFALLFWIGERFYNSPNNENNKNLKKQGSLNDSSQIHSQPINDSHIQDSIKKNKLQSKSVSSNNSKTKFAKIDVVYSYLPLIKENGLGGRVILNIQNVKPRIIAINDYLTKNKGDSTVLGHHEYKVELDELKSIFDDYLFDGTTIIVFNPLFKNNSLIIESSDKLFYLKQYRDYYYLLLSNDPIILKKISDSTLIEKLQYIVYSHSIKDNH